MSQQPVGGGTGDPARAPRACRGVGAWYFHLIGAPGALRSNANTAFGHGVWTNIIDPTTSGLPSWGPSTPVEKLQAGLRPPMFRTVIWSSGLYRESEASRPGIDQ